jgi:hypothetical protein
MSGLDKVPMVAPMRSGRSPAKAFWACWPAHPGEFKIAGPEVWGVTPET